MCIYRPCVSSEQCGLYARDVWLCVCAHARGHRDTRVGRSLCRGLSYGAADRVMYCRRSEGPRPMRIEALHLTPLDATMGTLELLEYRRHRALSASIRNIIACTIPRCLDYARTNPKYISRHVRSAGSANIYLCPIIIS